MRSTEFNQEQFDAIYPPGVERHYWSRARSNIIARFLAKSGLRKKRMLEVGCGRGIVLQHLRESGFDCFGVELSPVTVPKELGPYMYTGLDFKDLDPALRGTIEVVLLFDVIEHIEHDDTFLKAIVTMFPMLTHVVITVPARNELWSNFDVFNGHFRRYTRSSVQACIQRAGLTPVASSYFFHTLYVFARAFTVFGLTRSTAMRVPSRALTLLHTFIASVFRVEYEILPAWVVGTSVIAVGNVDTTKAV